MVIRRLDFEDLGKVTPGIEAACPLPRGTNVLSRFEEILEPALVRVMRREV